MKRILRSLRGWLYRKLPSWNRSSHTKRLAGLDRRWNLEKDGFTKEGLWRILRIKYFQGTREGHWLELRAGDGLVGSLGIWLETMGAGWSVESWEDRQLPLRQLQVSRPHTRVVAARLTDWKQRKSGDLPDGISTRGVREASAICRAVRKKRIRPRWIVIWNPSRRPVWAQRLQAKGYRLELAWHNLEFYVDRARIPDGGRRGSEAGGQMTEGGRRGTEGGGQESGAGERKDVNE